MNDTARLSDSQIASQVDAENEKMRAEAQRARAETRKAAAEAEVAEVNALKSRIELEKLEDKRAYELASDDNNQVLHFDEPVSASSCEGARARLAAWSRISLEEDEAPCEFEIIFQSPGGNVIAGMAFFDFLQSLKRAGHKITTRSRGWSASMAGILLQVGDVRVMDAESWLLIHRGSAGVSGDMDDIDDTVEWFKKIDERILNIFYEASRKGAKPFTRAALKKKYERKDWWLSSEEALLHGFCDEVQ